MDLPTLAKCPGYNLYISGFIALRRPKALRNCRITHIVSVMDWHFDQDNDLTRGFQHLHIPVDDVEDENLIRYFPRAIEFIHKGLSHWPREDAPHDGPETSNSPEDIEQGNGVLIHCAMGKSRSATILLAYLLWRSRQPAIGTNTATPSLNQVDVVPLPPKPLSVEEALMQLRQGRPIAEPNEGFMDQLYMFVDMGCPTTLAEIESHKLYRRFINRLNVAESLSVNQAPDVLAIRFEDEEDEDSLTSSASGNSRPRQEVAAGVSAPTGGADAASSSQTTTQIRCRRCRHILASTPHILQHTPSRSDPASQPCAHVFLHPLSWMKETLAEGALDGRLSCPGKNCAANVGKFAWQGMRCSCGGWVTPGFGVVRTKVDEVVTGPRHSAAGERGGAGTRHTPAAGSAGGVGAAGIRLPPGMRRGGNL